MAQATIKEPARTAGNQELTSRMSADQLKQAAGLEADRRRVIREFVRSQLEKDKDYGTIPMRGRNGLVSQSKPVLFKSGMEKIFSLFNVVSTLEKDTETIEMVGKPGVIAYKCTLTRTGQFIGEGRGAAEIAEKGRVNDAIKIAEKRARMDACLNLGFSEYFTQDLEDFPEYQEPVEESVAPKEVTGWKNSEVREVSFVIQEKEMKSSQAGTQYAVLHTDQGLIKAWKNTYPRFEVGKSYQAEIEASEWNGTISLAVVRFISEEMPTAQAA